MIYLLYGLIISRLLYWAFVFIKLAIYVEKASLNRHEGVSIVVAVKNNRVGLESLLKILLKQNHQNYEIIVVDDFSTDGVYEVTAQSATDKIVYCIPDKDMPGKKQAVVKGVSMAQYQWILVTDSDCIPSSLDWVSLMVGKAVYENKEIVLGYGPLEGKSLVSNLSRYETAYIGMQYLSYTLVGLPYMGVGRNMLYSKSLFLSTDPFSDNYDNASGDDDVFIQKAAKAENTTICIHPNAQCKSQSKETISGYIRQKTRHISTAINYNSKSKLLLGLFAVLHLTIYFVIIFMLVFGYGNLQSVAAAWALMCSLMLIVQYACFAKLGEQKVVLSLFVSDFLLSLLYTIIGFKTMFNNKKVWK